MSDRRQQIFDACAVHLLTQKQKSINSSGNCIYFGPNGLKCGAAPLLNELAEKDQLNRCGEVNILNETIIGVIDQTYFKDEFKDLTPNELDVARQLQHIHDHKNVEEWESKILFLASDFNLSNEAISPLLSVQPV
jgi:hypothetical protein